MTGQWIMSRIVIVILIYHHHRPIDHNYNDQIKKDKMGGECRTNWGEEKHNGLLVGKL
jgi:hypothetical protein